MPNRVPLTGERVGFMDDGYSERFGEVTEVGEFFGQVMLSVRPEGGWDEDELGEDGTLRLTLEECFEAEQTTSDSRQS